MTAWQGDIECEGGPILVANLDDFLQWHGSDPIDPALATELHYYSPFTGELPESWQPNGPTGHQYLASADPGASRDALIALVLARWPGTTVDRSHDHWRATRPDGRMLTVALSPSSEYDRAIRHSDTESLHAFGDGACAYLWDAIPGSVRIRLEEARDGLLLSQVEFADDGDAGERAHEHVRALSRGVQADGLHYRVTGGPVVVAWSPSSVRDLPHALGPEDTGRDRPGMLLDLAFARSAALVWLEPGTYGSTVGYHDAGDYGVAWCRLHRL